MTRLLADIRPEETRGAIAAFATLGLLMAAHALLETGRDALFLATLPAEYLPWMYLGIAGCALVITEYKRRAASGLKRRFVLSFVLIVGAVVTGVFWWAAQFRGTRPLLLLYVWTGVFGTIAVLQFWLAMTSAYTVVQAKRLFGFIGAGSILGATVGSATARWITGVVETRHVLIASSACMVLAAIAAAFPMRHVALTNGDAKGHELEVRDDAGLPEALGKLGKNPYVRRVAGLVLVSTVALTLTDYVFKSAVAQQIPARELGTFFSSVYTILNVGALLVQILLVGWLLDRIGVDRVLWLLPVFLVIGGVWAALAGGLLPVLLMKGGDGALRHSTHRTGLEVLYVPLDDRMRSRAKSFIDVVGHRGGQALGSILILASLAGGWSSWLVPVLVVLASLTWIASAATLKPHYLDLFRHRLRDDAVATRTSLPRLDQRSLELLFAALNSPRDAEVLAALELLRAEGKVQLVPALILHHPSSAVVLRAIEIFVQAKRHDFVSVAVRLLDHSDPEVRAAALRGVASVEPDEAILRSVLEDKSPAVRSTALVSLVSGGWIEGEDAHRALRAIVEHGTPEAKRALAAAIRFQPATLYEEVLLELVEDEDAQVRHETVRAMVEVRSTRFLPAMLPLLCERDMREAVRDAMVAMGPPALAFLGEALDRRDLPYRIRLHLPRSISRFEPADAAPYLMRHLVDEDGSIRFKVLRGLGRLRARDPDVPLERELLEAAAERTLIDAYRALDFRLALERGVAEDRTRNTPAGEVLRDLLAERCHHATERAFRLLALLTPGEDYKRIYRGLRSRDVTVRASSRELLANVLPARLRDGLLSLVDDVTPAERVARAGALYTTDEPEYEVVLLRLLESGSESLACIAAYHAAELGITALRPRLEAMRPSRSERMREVLEHALALLDRRAGPWVAHG